MPAEKTPASTPARQRILDTASRLFYRDGLRATGIDRIIAESGVAKMSFYRHFPSKAELIAAFLEARHAKWMAWFVSGTEKALSRDGAGLEAIAEVLGEWFAQADFRGCVFINTFAESGGEDGAERRIAAAHKAELRAYLEALAQRLALARPAEVAEAAMIVIEGSIVRAQMAADPAIVAHCRMLLAALPGMVGAAEGDTV